ncbi:MAG: 50S ribosomal protein L24 [Desulfurivibrionaceae bacterium]|nr:50S ribosomal protein L24 [Desulfurivibrionaceae bacterium]
MKMQTGRNYLKVDDQVEVIAGKDKGRVGKITRILPKDSRAIVEKINVVKRHTKPSMANQQGGILEKDAPIHVSNLMLICGKCAKPVRIKMNVLEDGTKTRACKKCGESIGD